MSKHEAAIGIANHILKTSTDQMIKGLARGFLELVEQNKELTKNLEDLLRVMSMQEAMKAIPNETI